MGTTFICPICGSLMFHDKGNHITFCAECDHVGWPHDAHDTHDAPVPQEAKTRDATAVDSPEPLPHTGEKQ